MNVGRGKFAKFRGVAGGRCANVEIQVHEDSGATIEFACSGAGFERQGDIEEVPVKGYDDWRVGAAAGVKYAFDLLGIRPRRVVVTKIEGMATDASPATVGAAAVNAVIDALTVATPESLDSKLIDIVFAGGLDADFTP